MWSNNAKVDALQCWIAVAGVVGTALIFWRPALADFMAPKFTVVVLAALGVMLVELGRLSFGRGGLIPVGTPVWGLLALAGAFLITSMTSGAPLHSLVGDHPRFSGAALYLAVLVLAVGISRPAPASRLVLARRVMLVAVLFTATYALFERSGVFLWELDRPYGETAFSTLANPNFASATFGLGVPLALAEALDRPRWWQTALWAPVLLVLGIAIATTNSFSGVLAGAAGGLVVAIGAIRLMIPAERRDVASWSLGIAASAAAVVGVLGLMGRGPASPLGDTLQIRRYYWSTALEQFAANPIFGVGPGRFGDFYREFAPQEAAVILGSGTISDDPHGVPFKLLAEGGILLVAAAVAAVVLVAFSLWRASRSLEDRTEGLLRYGFAGVWVGYLAQATVTVASPPVEILGWAGAGFALSAGFAHSDSIKLRRIALGRRGLLTNGLLGLAALALLGLLWAATVPVRADVSAGRGQSLVAQGDPAAGLQELQSAAELASYEPTYRFEFGAGLVRTGNVAAGLAAFERVVQIDPRNFPAMVTLARGYLQTGEPERAADWFLRALELDPDVVDLAAQTVQSLLEADAKEQAERVLMAALERNPNAEPLTSLRAQLP